MKYISAEKLIAEIERRIEETKSMKPSFDQFWAGQISAFKGVRTIIDSLQQERPEVQNGKFVFPKYLYARTKDNKTIDISYAPQDTTAVEYVRNDFVEQEQPETPSGAEVMTMCNQILIDWVKEGKTQEEREQREQAHIRFFELYDEYMQEQPEVDLEKEIDREIVKLHTAPCYNELRDFARHFYKLGLNARKEG